MAAGTLDLHQEGLAYHMLAHDNGFTFVYGALTALDAAAHSLTIAPVPGAGGDLILPQRTLGFSSLVLAVASTSHYFGVPRAQEHTISLNAAEDAERFRLLLLTGLAQADTRRSEGGRRRSRHRHHWRRRHRVELAAELREAIGAYTAYGFQQLQPERDVRILAPLSERVSAAARKLLAARGVKVVTACRVTSIGADTVSDANGVVYPASLCVWAAGIRAPAFLAQLGLPTKKGGQVEVDGALRVRGWADIDALGDCAASVDSDGVQVPPRAQAAHQQAGYLCMQFLRMARGKVPARASFCYRDYGSLVSLGERNHRQPDGFYEGTTLFYRRLFCADDVCQLTPDASRRRAGHGQDRAAGAGALPDTAQFAAGQAALIRAAFGAVPGAAG